MAASGLQGQVPTATSFWSTQGSFAGSGKCAECHAKQAESFRANSMSRALESADRCETLRGNVDFRFQSGSYSYAITRSGGQVLYRVSDGKSLFEAPLEYAFGEGKAGQTYVYRHEGEYYESRVSYYADTKALDLTVGARNEAPRSLLEAAGRIMKGGEPRNCFGCHTTGARVGTTFQLDHFEEGVGCESCHGPGGSHVEALAAGKAGKGAIRSLKAMDPQQSNEFCGACHRTWEAVMMMGLKGPNTARFPSYRITNSKCFSIEDTRISCTACHDPHGPLVRDAHYYDSKCLACHKLKGAGVAKASATQKACPRATENCVTCHMPRVESAEAHHSFPDHWIRIAKSKTDYPE